MRSQAGRIATMVGFGLCGAALLWSLGYIPAALGCLAALPVALFNLWLTSSSLRSRTVDAGAVMTRSLLRTVISVLALTAGYLFGNDVMLGVLIGLSSEVLSYFVEAVRILVRR